jgi:hypothetical protein
MVGILGEKIYGKRPAGAANQPAPRIVTNADVFY